MAVTTIVFPFEFDHANETQANREANRQIEEMFLRHIPPEVRKSAKIKVILNRIKKPNKRQRFSGPYKPEEILPQVITAGSDGKKDGEISFLESTGQVTQVNTNSLRYFVFQRDKCTCQACGLVGTAMFLERSSDTYKAHFNLYGYDEDGKEVLFSKDHKFARVKGGSDDPENLQTYCAVCNTLKGHSDATNEEIGRLRKIYTENKKQEDRAAAVRAVQKSLIGIGREAEYGKKVISRDRTRKAQEIAAALTVKLRETVVLCPVRRETNGSSGYIAHPLSKIQPKKRDQYRKLEAGTTYSSKKRVAQSVLIYLESGELATVHHTLLEPIYAQQEEAEELVSRNSGAGKKSSGQTQDSP